MSIGALASRSSSYSSMFMKRSPVLFCSGESACLARKAQGKRGFRPKIAVDSQAASPSAAAGLRRPRPAGLAAVPASAASSASTLSLSAWLSSRAATAIALAASNSSRLTRSSPPIHSRIRSCIADCASRVMPAMVPAAPFITLTKSSNKRFWDCISGLLDPSKNDIGARRLRGKGGGIRIEPPYLGGEQGREAQPGEIREQQKCGTLADPPGKNGQRDRQGDHNADQRQGRADPVEAEEQRRPSEVEGELDQEQADRGSAPARAACVQKHRKDQTEQDVKHRPGRAEQPARRHYIGLNERVEP